MFVAPILRRRLTGAVLTFLLLACLPALAQTRQRIDVEDYQIDVTLEPTTHRLTGIAKVKFTALDDISTVTFELHNGLRPGKVTDAAGKALSVERVSQDSTIRVPLPVAMTQGQSSTLTFEYEGTLHSADDSPVPGLRLAYVGEDSFLLYAGRWFPVNGYGTDRFTATIRVKAPEGYTVIGSGAQTSATAAPATTSAAPAPAQQADAKAPALRVRGSAARARAEGEDRAAVPQASGRTSTHTFVWDRASFPGTILAGKYSVSKSNAVGLNLTVYFRPEQKDLMGAYAEAAVQQFQFFTANLGPPMTNTLNVVALPDDTVPSAWAPELAAIASRAISEKVNYRLMANVIAHQWFGVAVSPERREDWWLADGISRFLEAAYVRNAAGDAAFEEVMKDLSVGALAYDTVPLSSVGRLDTFSPEFQTLATDKGAVIMNMLQWVIGDEAFAKTLQDFVKQYTGKPATVDDLRTIAEQHFGDQLGWFFIQWLNSTGAPQFNTKYTVYRVNEGFRVVGEIAQDLDLFRMPVELRVDTDGRSEMKRIDVVGTNSPFTLETFGRPRRIVVDPGNRVLKNSDEIKVRASILRGQGMVQSGDLAGALEQFQRALEANKISSLAHYRIAEVFFLQRNYQAAANAYREAISGDGEPRWTEVWGHIQLGKIFDITGQRDRATNEYRQALQTQDNTQGALDEARKYLQEPYQRENARSN
ncbi:MAG: M1 family aminopeptidase [Candidatus Korobacteraceae bacterium]